jgi:hypothetical protein
MRLIILRATLPILLIAMMVSHASADINYSVSGQFGADFTGFPTTGLAFGSFSGTFTTTLPSSTFETFASFDVKIFNASGALVTEISSATASDSGQYIPDFMSRDFIQFGHADGSYGLQLDFALNFNGNGPIIPTDTFQFSTFGSTSNSFVTITSGLVSVPEPLSLTLFGLGITLIAGRRVLDRRRDSKGYRIVE